MTAAAIAAQVVDIQNDRQHKGFIKVTLHVPSERGALLTESLGWPTYTDPVPVAIARLDPNKVGVATPSEGGKDRASSPHDPPPSHRLTTRAVMLAKDPIFHRWLSEIGKLPEVNEDEAAIYIRTRCGVASRSEIKPGTEAATKLDFIESAYICWKEKDRYVAA